MVMLCSVTVDFQRVVGVILNEIGERMYKHVKILLLFETAESHYSMTSFTLIWFREPFFNWVKNHAFLYLVREIICCVFGLTDEHVCMSIQMLSQPSKIITNSCWIITL